MAISFQKALCHSFLLAIFALTGLAQPETSKENSQETRAQSLIQRGNELVRAKKFGEAIELFQQAVAAKPNEVEPRILLGMAMIGAGRSLDALEEMKRATQLNSNSAHAFLGLGNANISLRRYAEAIEAFSQSARLNPDFINAHLNLGIAYGETKHIEESVESFKHALRIDPNHPSALNGIAIGYYRLGHTDQAVTFGKQAVKNAPEFADAYINLGRWYSELGRYEEAADAQAQVIRIAPRFPNGYRQSVITNFILGRSETVIKDATRGLELADWQGANSQFVIIFLALSQRRAGLEEEAKATLTLAVKRSDSKVWPYPIIRYLHNEIDENSLLQISNDNDRLTEAHAYIAVNLLLNKKPGEAREHFQWVKENGNKKFIEYNFTMNELQRMENLNTGTKRQ